jgi:ubiquinone/menaquinone biosynthesis C-methylase UbiE
MVRPRVPEGEEITDSEEISMEDYSDNALKRSREYKGLISHLIDVIGIPQKAHVLQIGPGPDWIGVWLAKERPDITIVGLEPSEDMIRVARRNADAEGISENQLWYVRGVVEDLSMFDTNSFDIVFSNDSLHHWVSPIDGFREVARVVRPEGGVCIADDKRDLGVTERFIVECVGRIVAGKWLRYWKSSIAASYTADEIEEMLEAAGIVNWNVEPEFLGIKVQKVAMSST